MARVDLAETLQAQVNRCIELGAVSEIGGGHEVGTSYFYPMVLSNIQKGMPAYDDELFGPVFSFFEVENAHEAIELANDTVFGLGATVWSENVLLAEQVALQLEAGAVAVNKVLSSDPRLPFGGIKLSGVGRELGKAGILEFVNQKSVVL
jgi:succinate-semialdehyde dehydrogenase/glutarate-semialdehyde dehydrogenase